MQSKVELLLKEVKDRTEALIKRYQGLELDFYVPLAGYCQDSRETFDLEKGINKLFQNEASKVLLLTGHSGSGKTSFGQMLIRKKWETCRIAHHNSTENEVFLWIPLLSIKKPEEELIKKHLKKNLDLTKQEIALILTSGYSFICVLDGYDELHTDKNLFLTNNLSALPGKIIFTCRDEILKADYRQRFMPSNPEEGFSEFRLLPFDELQKEDYLLRYVKHNLTEWDLDTYKSKLASIPELNNLISNPFLLSITVKVLSEILQNHTQVNEVQRIVLTRHEIYQAFIEQRFERQTEKLLKKDQEIKFLLENSSHVKKLIYRYGTTEMGLLRPPCIIIETKQGHKGLSYAELFARFTERMAKAMFKHHVKEINYDPADLIDIPQQSISSSKFSTFNWQTNFLDIRHDPGLEILLNAAPIISVGTNKYCFIHPSVLEFFAAKHLFNGALLYSWVLGEHNLNVSGLLDQTAIVKMLAERVKNQPEFAEALWEIIKMSRSEPTIWRAAANAITILNQAGVSFSGKNLRHIRIGGIDGNKSWGADLSRGVMDGADFGNADLRYVNFTNAWISAACFDGACMDGVVFGEQPWLDIDIPTSQWSFYTPYQSAFYASPDAKWLAIRIDHDLKFMDEIRSGDDNIWDGALIYLNLGGSNDIQLYRISETVITLGQRLRFPHYIRKISLSSEWIAVIVDEQTLDLFNLGSGERVYTLSYKNRLHTFKDMVFSNNGQYIAIYGSGGGVNLWNIKASGEMNLVSFIPSAGRVERVVFSPDDEYIFEVNNKSDIVVWDISNKALPQKVFVHKSLTPLRDCKKICFDASGKKIALIYPSEICIYNWSNKELSPFNFPKFNDIRIASAKFSHCGRWIATFGDFTIGLWNLSSGVLEYTLVGHKEPIEDISFITKDCLISFGRDKTIRSWSLNSDYLKNYETLSYRKEVEHLASNANGLWIAASNNQTLEIRETLSGRLLEVLKEPNASITQIAFHPTKNEEIIYHVEPGGFYRRHILTKEKQILPKGRGYSRQFALNSTGEKLVSMDCKDRIFGGGSLCLWELSSNQEIIKFLPNLYTPLSYKKELESIAFHPRENRVAMAEFYGRVLVANLNKNSLERTGTLQADKYVKSLSFHPKEQYLAGIREIDYGPKI
ncbi:MAG: NACHT domain-containing protein, partial [Tatlockia sp.]|nr:NACHT domain-containing protein [Tatlockia sp.]